MKTVDFSCKHDVLIRNFDGTLSHMDEPYFQSKLIAKDTWQILSDGDYTYLIVGGDEALVFDTGYGAGNIREYCQTLTDKPVRRAANSHFHFDHTAGNCYFDEVIMSKDTEPLAAIPYKSFEGITFPRDYKTHIVHEGDTIDLGGGRVLEVLEIPCHAVGSIALLDRKNRILFSGDEVNKMSNLNGSVSQLIRNMEKLKKYEGEFDICLGGPGPVEPALIDGILALAHDILDGKTTPEEEGPRPPINREGVPDGVTVYDRRGARPGDGGFAEFKEFKRKVSGHGVGIRYDVRFLED
ncbi:MAG: MBL fold metallo-hydrolase [Oscillospiraceae bacterium]